LEEYYLEGEERFGRVSSWFYAKLAQRFLADLHSFAAERVVERARAVGAVRILDVGSGAGRVACTIAQRLPLVEVIGVDPSTFMVRHAAASANRLGVKNVRFELGSSRRPPPGEFGVIYTVLSFHHWKDQAGSLSVLAPRLGAGPLLIFEISRSSVHIPGFRSHTLDGTRLNEVVKGTPFRRVETLGRGRLVEFALWK
jgi:SAM-dependent methyltransferase